jgi:hypothetical protein
MVGINATPQELESFLRAFQEENDMVKLAVETGKLLAAMAQVPTMQALVYDAIKAKRLTLRATDAVDGKLEQLPHWPSFLAFTMGFLRGYNFRLSIERPQAA